MSAPVISRDDFLVITDESSGKPYEVHPGSVVYVVLQENPASTGMSWSYRKPSSALVPDYDRFTPGARDGMVGVPGAHLFAFEVRVPEPMKGPLDEHLDFTLGRPSQTPQGEVRFQLRISPNH